MTRPFVPMARCLHPGCEQTNSGLRRDGLCHYHGARADGHGCEPRGGVSGKKTADRGSTRRTRKAG